MYSKHLFRKSVAAILSVMVFLTMLCCNAIAADGDLDTTFGTGGKVISAIGYAIGSLDIQPDGKIVALGTTISGSTGNLTLARYNIEGTFDSSFGTGGKVTTDVGIYDRGTSVVIQTDGKIVVGGANDEISFILRYNSDGTLDNSFGTNGKVTAVTGVRPLAIQSDGKIVAGSVAGSNSDADFALARYNSDGTLDSSFGTEGKVTTDFGSTNEYGMFIVISGDKIILTGRINNGSNYDFATVRYNSDGTLDNTFGTEGKVITNIGDEMAWSAAVQSDGKIIVVGNSNSRFAMVRYNIDGTLDNSFGTGGKVITAIGIADIAWAVHVQPDGKIVVTGQTYTSSGRFDFALARYNSNGTLDTTFGTGGKVITDIGTGTDDAAYTSAIQSDGKIILAGNFEGNLSPKFALARYENTIMLDMTVTKTGNGTVTSDPAGIDCGADCNEKFLMGNVVTLTATPDSGENFIGWSGACSGNSPTCTVTIDSVENVTANFTSSNCGCNFITEGLVACYSLEGNTNDSSVNNNHGVAYGDLKYIEGKFGQAVSFDGINDYIRVPLNSTLKFNPNVDSFTLMAWAKPKSVNDTDGSPTIWSCLLPWTPLIDTYTYFLSNQGIEGKRSGSSQGGAHIDSPIWDGDNWHLFVGTWGVEQNKITARFYIDGQIMKTNTLDSVVGGSYPWTDLLIGATHHCRDGSFSNFNFSEADIDEVGIYNRVLSESEIKQLYEGGSAPSNENECEIDLTNNTTTCNDLCPLTVMELGNGKSLVKLDLDPEKCESGNYNKVEFTITYDDDPVCYSAHIAKSEFADGTEQGDAEAFITDNDLNIRTEDCRQVVKSPAIAQGKDFTLKISNKNVAWNNGLAEIGSLYSDSLIQLNQNSGYDFYAAFNRTVGDAAKTGSGVAKVKIRFLKELPMLSLGDVNTCIGNKISIPLILNNPGGEAIHGIDVRIPYPASLIPGAEAVTLIKGILENKGYDFDYNVTNGEIRIGIYAEEETFFAGSGTIAYLNFETAHAGNAELSFTKGLVNEKSVDTKAGKVEIGNCCTVSGRVLYYSDNQRAVPDVTVTIEGNGISETTVTDEDGYYEITVPCGNDYTVTLSKDNHLGGLSFFDVSKIARFVAEFADAMFTPLQMLAADVDMDGDVDAVDASRVSRYIVDNIVGNIECMNDDCINWIFIPENQQYKPLNESMTDQDFIGIRLGDVTGSWTKDASRRPKTARSVSSEYRLNTNSGSRITVPVILNQDDSIEGIDILINFDKNILRPRAATLKGGILADKGYNLLYGVKNAGEMKIGISADSNIVKDKGNLVFITFDVIGKGISPISLTSFDCNESKAAGGFSAGSRIYDKLQVFVK